jgi:pimeloyl-ACP methyl ester carboxylesterase
MNDSVRRIVLGLEALTLTILLAFWIAPLLAAGPPATDVNRELSAADLPAWAANKLPCLDTSNHKVRFVTVEPGVRLEVLDWGGRGEPMVLLTGLGDNAHVYDHFAYQWTERFRVFGITRRGFGRSSKPALGYDVDARARDEIAVLDLLHLPAAIFVGHSIAGDELSKLGAVYPDRVKKLVYLDAYDYGAHAKLAQPPSPDFTPADAASVERYSSANARFFGHREPNAAVCGTIRLDKAGNVVGAVTPPEISEKIKKGSQQAQYDRITAPALGIFATWTLQTRLPLFYYLTPAQQAEYEADWPPLVAWQADAIHRFRTGIRNVRVVELPEADHYIYLNNEARVVREMRHFLLGAVRN